MDPRNPEFAEAVRTTAEFSESDAGDALRVFSQLNESWEEEHAAYVDRAGINPETRDEVVWRSFFDGRRAFLNRVWSAVVSIHEGEADHVMAREFPD